MEFKGGLKGRFDEKLVLQDNVLYYSYTIKSVSYGYGLVSKAISLEKIDVLDYNVGTCKLSIAGDVTIDGVGNVEGCVIYDYFKSSLVDWLKQESLM